MRDVEWFAQLEAIPGVGYTSPLGAARQKLPGALSAGLSVIRTSIYWFHSGMPSSTTATFFRLVFIPAKFLRDG